MSSTHDSPVADLVEEFDRWATSLVSSSSSASSASSTIGHLDGETHGQDDLDKEDMQDKEPQEPLSPQEELGKLLENFYLSFRTSSLEELAKDLRNIESFKNKQHESDNKAIMEMADEIAKDARKKAAQSIRGKFTDSVRNLISQCRKKIIVKTSSSGATSGDHTQRHLNILIELLGSWSNMIAEIECVGLSRDTLISSIQPLHERVLEASMECYTKFKEDKYIINWQKKVMMTDNNIDVESNSENDNSNISINLVSLDAAISQMTAIRSIVFQYFVYLEDVCGDFASTNWTNVYSQQWKVLDADYIALEFGYITKAIETALAEKGCLEVQPMVYAIQAVEDAFFVLQRVLERVLSTGDDASIFSVCNKIVEVLDPNQQSVVYSTFVSQERYKGCYEMLNSLIPPCASSSSTKDSGKGAETLNRYASSSSSQEQGVTDSGVEGNRNSGKKDQEEFHTGVGAVVSTIVGEELAELGGELKGLGIEVASNVVGMGMGFLGNIAAGMTPAKEKTSSSGDNESKSATPKTSATSSKNKLSIKSPSGSTSNLEELFEKVLEEVDPTAGLSIQDACIRLNSIAAATSSLESLASSTSEENLDYNFRSIDVINSELQRLLHSYKSLLSEEMLKMVTVFVTPKFSNELHDCFMNAVGNIIEIQFEFRYNISGDDMERRLGSSGLVQLVTSLVDKNSVLIAHCKPSLSLSAYHEMLQQIAKYIGDNICGWIIHESAKFSEWGAMLLWQEVINFIEVLEQEATDVDTSVRAYGFSKLLWSLKILTLDQPADIRRYMLPTVEDIDEYLDDDVIRLIMSKRIEFSKDAVAKVKIGRKSGSH